ncbi:hypothetical protein [Chitinolyticbacter albus]|uniref:hypothetical protein n=1 Tax=Chitinolyticbacter albus TaxID=2961951 RepID=UPI002109E4CE|nr:hypothetical protein [Chitinolyticbacter albus]
MPLDISQLVLDMQAAATSVLKADVTTFRGFSDRQLKAIAQQAELVRLGITTGQITDETREFFLDGLEDMALSFARTLRGLLIATVEKVWNALVGVLWKAISTATGLILPIPTLGADR